MTTSIRQIMLALLTLALTALSAGISLAQDRTTFKDISREALLDRIRGGWTGHVDWRP